MKRSRQTLIQTPIKKWQQMSPMQDELAIVESDLSEHEQPELFHSLVGHSPHSYQHIQLQSPTTFSNEEDQLTPMSYCEQSQSMEQQFQPTVNQMKVQRTKQETRVALKQIDPNRKGCNCRNSKCQKNYCDCLRNGLVCGEGLCSCENCNNKEVKKIHHDNTKKQILEVEVKGCHCKKSRCLKKYCECHSGGRKCSPLCECVECYNRDENEPEVRETLRRLRPFAQIGQIY